IRITAINNVVITDDGFTSKTDTVALNVTVSVFDVQPSSVITTLLIAVIRMSLAVQLSGVPNRSWMHGSADAVVAAANEMAADEASAASASRPSVRRSLRRAVLIVFMTIMAPTSFLLSPLPVCPEQDFRPRFEFPASPAALREAARNERGCRFETR